MDEPKELLAPLTAKQRRFVDAYMECLNAAEAARRAKYSVKTARAIGCENLTKPNIRDEIKRRMEEYAMPSREVLHRLAEQARGDVGDFIDPATLTLDMKKAVAGGKTRLIKKVKQTFVTRTVGTEEQQTEIFEFELYDAQKALALLGKYHALFVDRGELKVETRNMDYGEFMDNIEDAFEQERVAQDRRSSEEV